MISFLSAVIIAIIVISLYFVFVLPPEHSESDKAQQGNENSKELFEYFENHF